MLQATSKEVGDEDTSARCEGGEGGDGEVVKVMEGDQSLCPASLTALTLAE
jgi:hypothetical protein